MSRRRRRLTRWWCRSGYISVGVFEVERSTKKKAASTKGGLRVDTEVTPEKHGSEMWSREKSDL